MEESRLIDENAIVHNFDVDFLGVLYDRCADANESRWLFDEEHKQIRN